MGQDENRLQLLNAARALVARSGEKFSIASVCAEAGVERSAFKAIFGGKAALMAALVAPEPQAAELPTDMRPKESGAAQEPGVSTPDAWLERRLRVFERALNAMETRQEAMARDHALAIAELEDKLSRFGMRREEVRARLTAEAMVPAVAAPDVVAAEPVEQKPAPEKLDIAPQPLVTVSKAQMADVLQTARARARPVEAPPAPDNTRLRWLAIGALSLVALFLCAGLTFGKGDAQAVALTGTGETHRRVAADAGGRLVALADAGDAKAQARLALAYLKGDGAAADKQAAARWSASAADAGVPVAQYLAGALTDDKTHAFELFGAAAAKGNIKAMHNLAIAYAQGLGTKKDEAKAAEWFARAAERGYVDSAFDLAVLYERGQGVSQDLKQALKWYAVAAFTGDQPSQARVAFLRTQMKPDEVKLAMGAAGSFAPLPVTTDANAL